MIKNRKSLFSRYISTYDKNDFFNNWKKVDKNLGERWDNVAKYSPHRELKNPTLTDKYFVNAIVKLLLQWIPHRKGIKVLKFDLYNEATMTSTLADWFLSRGYDYYGVDISKEIIRLAKRNFKGKVNSNHFKLGDIRRLPFKDETFDVVFSFGTIEHIRENAKSVSEAYRVLKPGGIFITGVNNKLDLWFSYFVNESTSGIFKHITSYEPSYFPWEQRKWLKDVGFEQVKTSGMIMFPHLVRYLDLFIEWKQINGSIRFFWDNIIIKTFIKLASFLDGINTIRLLGMHTTSFGYKPKSSKKYKKRLGKNHAKN